MTFFRMSALCLALCAAFPALAGEIPPVPPRKPPVPSQVALAYPVAKGVVMPYPKGVAIKLENLTIINTGELDAEGRALCQFLHQKRDRGGNVSFTTSVEPMYIGPVNVFTHEGRIFTLSIRARGADGTILAAYSSHAPNNYKTLKAKLAAKTGDKRASRH